RVEVVLENRLGFEASLAGPGFAGRAAPVRLDQADGNVLALLEIAAEEVADGAEIDRGFRRAFEPDAAGLGHGDSALRLPMGHFLYVEEADVRVLRGVRGLLSRIVLLHSRDLQLHVRLARAEPDVADQHA